MTDYFLDHDLVKWLCRCKKVNMIGTDATGIELRNDKGKNQPNHQYLMDRGIPSLESMTNLESLEIANTFTMDVHAKKLILFYEYVINNYKKPYNTNQLDDIISSVT